MARSLYSNSVPRAELDYRARDARLRLVKVEQLLVVRSGGRDFRLARLFGWRFLRAPKLARTRTSLNTPRSGPMPEIDSGCFRARAA